MDPVNYMFVQDYKISWQASINSNLIPLFLQVLSIYNLFFLYFFYASLNYFKNNAK